MRGFQFQPGRAVRLFSAIHYGPKSQDVHQAKIRSNGWTLDYSLAAGLEWRVDGTPWLLREPFVAHLYPPDFTYYERNRKHGRFMHSLWVQFDGDLPLLTGKIAPLPGFAEIRDPERILQQLLNEAVSHAQNGWNAYWAAAATLCRLIGVLETIEPDGVDPWSFRLGGDKLSEPLHVRVKQYLQAHFREKILLPQLAAAHGVSVSTLSHRYHEAAGESILATLIRLRLEQSLPLLRKGERLKAVADAVGFCNEFYYSRRFRAFYGVSPAQWLRENNPSGSDRP